MPGAKTELRRALRRFKAALKAAEKIRSLIMGDTSEKKWEADCRRLDTIAAVNKMGPEHELVHDCLVADDEFQRLRKDTFHVEYVADELLRREQREALEAYDAAHCKCSDYLPCDCGASATYRAAMEAAREKCEATKKTHADAVTGARDALAKANAAYERAWVKIRADRDALLKEADAAVEAANTAYYDAVARSHEAYEEAIEEPRRIYYEAKDKYLAIKRAAEAAAKEAYNKVMRGEA